MQAVRPTMINYNIPNQLAQIADIGNFNARFQIIPDAHKFTTQTVWNKTHAFGAFVLGLLTAYAYKQAQKNIAIALGVLAGAHLLKTRASIKVDSPEYAAQKEAIQEVFCGLKTQLQEMHRIISEGVAQVVNQEHIDNLNDANRRAGELVIAYTAERALDPFDSLQHEDKSWQRNAHQAFGLARQIAVIPQAQLNADQNLNPLVKDEINKLIPLAQQFVFGRVPNEGEQPDQIPYVHVELQGAEGNQRAVARAWNVVQRA